MLLSDFLDLISNFKMTFIWNYDFADSANCQLSWQLIDRIISGFCLKCNIFVAELSFVTKSRFFDKDEVCNFRHMCWVSPNFHLSWSDSIKLWKLIYSPWNHLLIKSVNINCRIVLHVVVKFLYSEKATKFCKILPLVLTVCTAVKSKGKIL